MDNTAVTPPPQQSSAETQQLPPQQQAELPMQSPPKKKHLILKIVLTIIGIFIILSLLLVGGIAYFLQSQGLTPDKLNPQPKAPATTIAPRDTKTNTYTNQNYKFSMPIEKELEVEEKPYGFGVSSVEMRNANTTSDDPSNLQMLMFPKALGAAIGQDFDKHYNAPENTTEEVKDPDTGYTQSFTKVRNRTVSNLRAFEFTSKPVPVDPDIESEIGVYIEVGNDVIVITTGESSREKLEAMLVDFKYPL